MSMSSQEPRGQGLSSSLVSDFRAILNSLEQEKVSRSTEPAAASPAPERDPVPGGEPQASSAHPAPAEPAPAMAAEPVPARPATQPPRRYAPSERPAPMAYAELRSRIAALGDVKDMFPARPVAEAAPVVAPAARITEPAPRIVEETRPPEPRPAEAHPPVAPAPRAAPSAPRAAPSAPVAAPSEALEPRRRGFGAARRSDCDAPARRRRSASSSEAITWQRVGVLVACMVVVGGGAVALQSVVGRDETKVAADAIGNAAIASVAPSSGASLISPAVAAFDPVSPPAGPKPEPAMTEVAAAPDVEPEYEPETDAESAADALASVQNPMLRNARPVFNSSDLPELPASVTAFAPGGANIAGAASEPADAATVAAPPKRAPVPPPAPVKHAAAKPAAKPTETVVVAAGAPADVAGEEPDVSGDTADSQSAFGGDPVGVVALRSSVSMRTAPKRNASVISNLPAGQKVELVGCTNWCEVIVEGKRGYVYRSYVDQKSLQQADAAPE